MGKMPLCDVIDATDGIDAYIKTVHTVDKNNQYCYCIIIDNFFTMIIMMSNENVKNFINGK